MPTTSISNYFTLDEIRQFFGAGFYGIMDTPCADKIKSADLVSAIIQHLYKTSTISDAGTRSTRFLSAGNASLNTS